MPALLPSEPAKRAQVRALALHIACDLHPLNNLRVLQYLTGELGVSEAAKDAWYRHWLHKGLAAVEAGLVVFDGCLSLGERPGYLEAVLTVTSMRTHAFSPWRRVVKPSKPLRKRLRRCNPTPSNNPACPCAGLLRRNPADQALPTPPRHKRCGSYPVTDKNKR